MLFCQAMQYNRSLETTIVAAHGLRCAEQINQEETKRERKSEEGRREEGNLI